MAVFRGSRGAAVMLGVLVSGLTSVAASCSVDEECSLLGVCTAGSCVCDPGWSGQDCGQLRLAPATYRSGYNLTAETPPTYSWGANIFPGGAETTTWHMYAAEFENHCDISRWSPNSAIVHATSSTGPEGPYRRQGVAVKPFAHNPKVVRHPDGTWLMFTIGVPMPAAKLYNCSGDDHVPRGSNAELDGASTTARGGRRAGPKPDPTRPGRNPSNLESNITLFTAPSVAGPWTSAGVVLGADYFASWDEDTSNPSPWVLPNGTVLLMYRGCIVDANCRPGSICGCNAEYIGIASAPSWKGPYTRLSNDPILPKVTAEDPSMWIDGRGHYHFLMHYIGDSKLVARHAFARSYAGPWQIHVDSIPYTTTVDFVDGSSLTYHKRERPHIVWDGKTGKPSHLITGVVQPGDQSGYAGGSYTLIQPITVT